MDDLIGLVVGVVLTALGVLLALWVAGMWKPALPAFLGGS